MPATGHVACVSRRSLSRSYVYAVGLGEDNSCKDANAVCRDDPLTNATGCSLWNVKLSPDPIQRGTVLDATRNRLYVTSGGGQSGHGQLFALQMNPGMLR